MAGGRCAYTHDVTDHADVDGETWRCPHPPLADGLCVFHAPPSATDDGERVDAFRAAVAADDRPSAFLGATFDRFALPSVRLAAGDAAPVDLRDAHVAGDLDWSRLHSELPVRLDGLVVEGTATFDDAHFDKEFAVSGATFEGPTSFFDATFVEDARFTDVRFGALATFYDVHFREDARFTDSRFDSYAKFTRVTVGGKAQFGRVGFAARTYVTDATLGGDAWFDDATFEDLTAFRDSRFGGTASFDGAWFHGRTGFADVEFHDDASFVGVETTAPVDLDGCRFERTLDWSGRLAASLSIDAVDVGRALQLRDLETVGARTVSLAGSTLPAGRLEQPRDGTVTYDLRGATVGDVAVGRPGGPALFERYHFEGTTFDGFDFSDYGAELSAAGWTIHSTRDGRRRWLHRLVPAVLAGSVPTDDTTEDVAAGERAAAHSRLEGTYLRAKNGANAVGDAHAAAEFFIHELKHRRRKHFWHALDVGERPGSAGAVYRWVANLSLALTAGYGERPSHVVLSSAAAILGFALAFAALVPGLYDAPAGFVALSTGAFVALFFGDPGPIGETPLLSTLAQVEAIVGAFLVAMFVFTLTRSIHR
jgi:hypothetical protein